MSSPFVDVTLPGRVPMTPGREIPRGQSLRWRFCVARLLEAIVLFAGRKTLWRLSKTRSVPSMWFGRVAPTENSHGNSGTTQQRNALPPPSMRSGFWSERAF